MFKRGPFVYEDSTASALAKIEAEAIEHERLRREHTAAYWELTFRREQERGNVLSAENRRLKAKCEELQRAVEMLSKQNEALEHAYRRSTAFADDVFSA